MIQFRSEYEAELWADAVKESIGSFNAREAVAEADAVLDAYIARREALDNAP